MFIWALDLDWQDSWEWVPSTSDHSSISLYQLWVMSTPHIERERKKRTPELRKVNFSILTHLNFDLFLRMCIITSSVPNLNYYSLKSLKDYFLAQPPFNFVCWWCKFPHKNLGTHNGCLQKLVDKKVHGVGERPSHCKNRK